LRFEDWPELVEVIANALNKLQADHKEQGVQDLVPAIGG
jgi:hypothetical protein